MTTLRIAVDEDYACIIEMCKAHDKEEAAQKGEPDPWEEGIFDDEFVAERESAMSSAFMIAMAYFSAKRDAIAKNEPFGYVEVEI